jgi:hypothetical protein
MTLYKVTDEDGRSFHGGSGRWIKGRWRSVEGELDPCVRGLHLCREQDLIRWLGPVIWEAEAHPDADIVEAEDKVVVSKARVVRRLGTWDERTARLFAADCAEHVLPIWEAAYPEDARPRLAIEAARAYARGEIDSAARSAAEWAARSAAEWAAGSAAGSAAEWDAGSAAEWAARSAAEWAARSAAGSAAESAAWSAARSAAWWAAESAARSAAEWAAESAAWSAARSAAWSVCRMWQTARLMEYLRGDVT